MALKRSSVRFRLAPPFPRHEFARKARDAGAKIVIRRGLASATAGLAALCALTSGAQADSIPSGLLGAWTTYPADCAKIFARRGGGIVFRQPIDKFAQAVIITPSQIFAPASVCRVEKVTRSGDAYTITGECKDAISYTPATLRIKTQSPGAMVYSPSADAALDTTLAKCSL